MRHIQAIGKKLIILPKILQYQITLVVLSIAPFGLNDMIQYLQMMRKLKNPPYLVLH